MVQHVNLLWNLNSHFKFLFKWVSSLHQVVKVLEFQLQHQSFQWTPMISFRMDWLDLLAVQGTHLKRPWCWERLKVGGEGDNRGWDGWMASTTQWTWVWVNSGSWQWTGRPGVLQSIGSQRVGQDWATELNWIITSFFGNFIPKTINYWIPTMS